MRFKYSHSSVYGWTVYDTERGCTPAYDACSELLPRVTPDTSESPVMLPSEYAAMRLCMRLNGAYRKSLKGA